MKEEEIKEEIRKKIYAAKFALNPHYDIPSKSDKALEKTSSNFESLSLEEAGEKVVKALLNAKQYDEQPLFNNSPKTGRNYGARRKARKCPKPFKKFRIRPRTRARKIASHFVKI